MTKARDIANAGTALTTVSATELGYLDGVTSAVQTQLNAKQAVVSGVNDTEIGYLDGVTSAIQTQLNAKAVYPSQTGNSGKYLTTDGSSASWGTVSSGGMTLLSTTTLSGVTTTISSISQDYKHLMIILKMVYNEGEDSLYMRVNSDTGNNYYYSGSYQSYTNFSQYNTTSGNRIPVLYAPGSATAKRGNAVIWCYNYTSTDNQFINTMGGSGTGSGNVGSTYINCNHIGTSAISSVSFNGNADNLGGTVYIYGVN